MTPRALVLGGTSFVGRHLVQRLLDAGHDVTLFTRGRTNPHLFPDVPRLVGDRRTDTASLAGGTWDVVHDVSAYHPDDVDRAAEDLDGGAGHYVFVSTVSVYAALPVAGLDEDAPLARLDREPPAEPDPDLYGELKALAEDRVAARWPSRTVARPTVVVGPHDPTDRFTYWVRRLAEPGPHLVPPLDAPLQWVDARDLAAWLVHAGEQRVPGAFNLAAPPQTFADLVRAVGAVTGRDPEVVAPRGDELLAAGLAPWQDLPLWLGPDAGDKAGLLQVDPARALAAGFTPRSLEQTVADTLDWVRGRDDAGDDAAARPGLTPEREADLVERFR